MDDDDFDFNPVSSKLSSLFGVSKTHETGNSSFVYTAPKQPKSAQVKGEPIKESNNEPSKLSLLLTKTCIGYRLQNGVYATEGKLGIAILGNATLNIHHIILYKSTNDHKSKVRISENFTLTVSSNNYISYYDDSKQNWSLMFDNFTDLQQVLQQITIAKYNSLTTKELLIQDLTPCNTVNRLENCIIDLTFECSLLEENNLKQHCSRDTSSTISFQLPCLDQNWETVLKGIVENSQRIVIIPCTKIPPCSSVQSTSSVLLKINVVCKRNKVEPVAEILLPAVEKSDHNRDSSTEDSSIKGRVASIQEALSSSPKSHKANLISRMERMGQATLPVKPNIPTTASDSEEDSSTTAQRFRPMRSKVLQNNHTQNVRHMNTSSTEQSVLVYQPEQMLTQQQVIRSMPVMSSPVVSPVNDAAMAIYLSESRSQATELRLGVAKVTDKVDLVLNKLDKLESSQDRLRNIDTTLSADPTNLLTGLQTVISENSRLKQKVEEQKLKLENQNDRIYQLLELNQKFLEQNNPRENQADLEIRKELESIKSEKQKLLEELEKSSEVIKQQNENMKNITEVKQTTEQNLEKCLSELNELKIKYDESLVEKSEELTVSRELCKNLSDENKLLSDTIQKLQVEVEQVRNQFVGSEEELKILNENKNNEIDNLNGKILKLEDENRKLKSANKADVVQDETASVTVKKVMNTVYKNLIIQFSTSRTYSDVEIKRLLATTIRDVTLEYLERKEPPQAEQISSSKVPQPKVELSSAEIPQPKIELSSAQVPQPKVELSSAQVPQPKVELPSAEIPQPKIELSSAQVPQPKVELSSAQVPQPKVEPRQEPLPESHVKDEPVIPQKQTLPGEGTVKVEENKIVQESDKIPSTWSSSRPPPPPLLDDDDEDDDWLS